MGAMLRKCGSSSQATQTNTETLDDRIIRALKSMTDSGENEVEEYFTKFEAKSCKIYSHFAYLYRRFGLDFDDGEEVNKFYNIYEAKYRRVKENSDTKGSDVNTEQQYYSFNAKCITKSEDDIVKEQKIIAKKQDILADFRRQRELRAAEIVDVENHVRDGKNGFCGLFTVRQIIKKLKPDAELPVIKTIKELEKKAYKDANLQYTESDVSGKSYDGIVLLLKKYGMKMGKQRYKKKTGKLGLLRTNKMAHFLEFHKDKQGEKYPAWMFYSTYAAQIGEKNPKVGGGHWYCMIRSGGKWLVFDNDALTTQDHAQCREIHTACKDHGMELDDREATDFFSKQASARANNKLTILGRLPATHIFPIYFISSEAGARKIDGIKSKDSSLIGMCAKAPRDSHHYRGETTKSKFQRTNRYASYGVETGSLKKKRAERKNPINTLKEEISPASS